MSDFLKLAERVEKAAGPERGLDWACHGARLGNSRLPRDELDRAPHYTASIDAATLLVPDEWTAVELCSRQARSAWKAEISRMNSGDEEFASSRRCKTPALALTAAALRARSTQ